jgi:nucleotide-binding universal stress UspA family protein
MANLSTDKILLAIDQSRQAENAVHYVASLPLTGRMEITLFHVRRNLPAALSYIGMTPEIYKALDADQEEAWLRQEEQNVEQFLEASRQIFLKAGYPAKGVVLKAPKISVGFARDIIAEAGQGYAAVVVGRTGLSKLKDAVMGSIASKLVARLGRVPVWVIGGQPQGGKILVALDASEGSLRTVDHVARIIGSGPQEVLLFHVIRSLEYGGQYAQNFISDEWEKRLIDEGEKAMEPVFKKAAQRLTVAGLAKDSVKTLLVSGVPSRAGAIADIAQQQEYGTIVVGRRGISRVEEFFIGRVGNKVLNFAKKHAVWVVS